MEQENQTNTTNAAPLEQNHEAMAMRTLGPVIGLLIITLMLILGGLYLWGSNLTVEDITPVMNETDGLTDTPNTEPETVRTDTDIETLKTVSSSDEISAIEADIDSTNIDSLNAEMQTIEAEINNFEAQFSE